jgi:hypothetical protein
MVTIKTEMMKIFNQVVHFQLQIHLIVLNGRDLRKENTFAGTLCAGLSSTSSKFEFIFIGGLKLRNSPQMKTLDVITVDSFTKIPFAGNPAAVCFLEEKLDETIMKKIARELNLSETSFVQPVEGKANTFLLRWLTPTTEVGLCGHATCLFVFS